jgi:serine/threonine-protein kinase HipA
MSERTLLVSINNAQIGTLRDENGIWSFKYDSAWLNDQQHFSLSPSRSHPPK